MGRYEVRVTDYAVGQMAEVTQYISETLASPEAAKRLLAALKSTMAECAYLPSRYALVQREPWKSEGIRLITVRNFHAYYRIDEEKEAGLVHRRHLCRTQSGQRTAECAASMSCRSGRTVPRL